MDNFPKCDVCQQLFALKGPVPYLLPCLHAVCETCVTSTSGGVICSSCQTEVNLTETHLQKDVVRQREIFQLTVQHRPSELLCTHEDDGNQAVCWCQECEEFLCEHCQNMHESFKAYRKHSVQNIGDIQPGSLEYEEYCNIHPKFILEYRDKVCNIQICNRCRRGDHSEHDVEDIDVAADLARTEMGGQLMEVQEAVTRHTSYLEVTKEQVQNTEKTCQALENQITATFSSLKTFLVQREKGLLIALEQHKEKTKSVLGLQTEVFQSKYKKCKTTSEYIQTTLLYCSKHDLLNLRNQMGETTRDCLASGHPNEPEDIPAIVFSIDGLEKMKSWMSSFGAIGPVTDLSTLTSLKKDNSTQVEIKQFTEVEDQHKRAIQQLQNDLSTSNSQIEELQGMMKDLTKDKDKAEHGVAKLTKQKEKAEQDVTRLTKDKDKAEHGVTRLTKEKKKAKQEVARLTREKEDLKKSNERVIQQLQNDLSTSNSKLEELQVMIKDLTKEKEKTEQDVTRLTRDKDKAEHGVTRLTKQKEKAEQDVTRLTKDKNKAEHGVTRLTKEKKKAEQEVARLTREKEDLKKSNERIESDLQNAKKSITRLQTSLTNIGLPLDATPYLLQTAGLQKSLILLYSLE